VTTSLNKKRAKKLSTPKETSIRTKIRVVSLQNKNQKKKKALKGKPAHQVLLQRREG